MGTYWTIRGLFLGLMFFANPVFAESIQPLNVDGIANAMGKQGELTGTMYKVSFPRSDLTVKIGNVGIKPALALINWAAFIKSGDTVVTYGDLVLLEDEINPVISKLEERGIELSALIIIFCTKALGSCTSISLDAATKWKWRAQFGKRSGLLRPR